VKIGTGHFLAITTLCVAVTANATVVQGMDVAALAQASQRVIRGRVITTRSQWDPSGLRISTTHTVEVDEVLTGESTATVSVFQWGGLVNGIGQRVMGEAHLVTGDNVVLFLERAPTPGVFRLVGLAQGAWRVQRGPRGDLQVFRPPAPLTLHFKGAASGAPVADRGAVLRDYNAFRRDVMRGVERAP
jgi:hypothetical protein